jgi:hypothetical protein
MIVNPNDGTFHLAQYRSSRHDSQAIPNLAKAIQGIQRAWHSDCMPKLVGVIELSEFDCSGRYSTPAWILSHSDGCMASSVKVFTLYQVPSGGIACG